MTGQAPHLPEPVVTTMSADAEGRIEWCAWEAYDEAGEVTGSWKWRAPGEAFLGGRFVP